MLFSVPYAPVSNRKILPFEWNSRDIGSIDDFSDWSRLFHPNNNFLLSASGADIFGTADAFHFAYQPLSGDGTIVARVISIENTHSWAKAGVMIRETLDSNARNAMAAVTAGQGVSFQRRLVTGGISYHTTVGTARAPYWVKLERTGDTFTGYQSADGSNWSLVGSDTVTMASDVYAGLAATSHVSGTLGRSLYTDVSLDA